MWAILPVIGYLFLYIIVYSFQKTSAESSPWREAFLLSSILWALFVLGATEVLNIFRWIDFRGILSAWIIFILFLGAVYVRFTPRVLFNNVFNFGSLSKIEKIFVLCIVTIFCVIGLICLVSLPYTADALTYRLPRIMHWIQNYSVDHYPTAIERQLRRSPWSDFAMLHFMVLGAKENFYQLISWFGSLGCVISASLIAQKLGANRKTQIISGVIVSSIPIFILNASIATNHSALGFWICAMVYYLLSSMQDPKWKNLLLAALAVGLAVATKGTAYIFCLPFFIWFGLYELHKKRVRSAVVFVFFLLSVFVLNAGHYYRNYNIYENPLGKNSHLISKVYTPQTVLLNVVRHSSAHLSTFHKPANRVIYEGIKKIHEWLGWDIDDRKITHLSFSFSLDQDYYVKPFRAGNPLHFLAFLYCFILLWAQFKKVKNKQLVWYGLTVFSSFLLFMVMIVWQPFLSRLHIPIFVLSAPFIAISLHIIFGDTAPQKLAVFLLIFSIPSLFFNRYASFFGSDNIFNRDPTEKLFALKQENREPYISIADYLVSKECKDIGLFIGESNWEYQYWMLLKERGMENFRMEHVFVKNPSKKLYESRSYKEFTPCAIISIVPSPNITSKGKKYARKFQAGVANVYEPAGSDDSYYRPLF